MVFFAQVSKGSDGSKRHGASGVINLAVNASRKNNALSSLSRADELANYAPLGVRRAGDLTRLTLMRFYRDASAKKLAAGRTMNKIARKHPAASLADEPGCSWQNSTPRHLIYCDTFQTIRI